jgi:hypothetical protein
MATTGRLGWVAGATASPSSEAGKGWLAGLFRRPVLASWPAAASGCWCSLRELLATLGAVAARRGRVVVAIEGLDEILAVAVAWVAEVF